MILDAGLTAMDILKAIGSALLVFVVGYGGYMIKTLMARLKTIETELSNQQVKNQIFTDHNIWLDKDNKTFKDAVVSIGDKIDNLKTSNVNMKESFERKFGTLTASIHKLELKIVSDKNGK